MISILLNSLPSDTVFDTANIDQRCELSFESYEYDYTTDVLIGWDYSKNRIIIDLTVYAQFGEIPIHAIYTIDSDVDKITYTNILHNLVEKHNDLHIDQRHVKTFWCDDEDCKNPLDISVYKSIHFRITYECLID